MSVIERRSKEWTSRSIRPGWWYALGILWTVLLVTATLVTLRKEYSQLIAEATAQAKSDFEKDLVYRRWAASHGGVYVEVTEQTQPNPYLADIPDRDVVTQGGKHLTLINPAYMTRQVHEMGNRLTGSQGHITSLNPIRPENRPDPWEAEALRNFEAGAREVTAATDLNGLPYLRYMGAMTTDESCLKCHQQQGYQVGQVRGGLGISVPLKPYLDLYRGYRRSILAWMTLLWALGVGCLTLAYLSVRDRNQAILAREERYRELVDHLESGVAVYTPSADGKSFIFSEINEAGKRFARLEDLDVIGMRIDEAFPAVDSMGLLRVLEQVSRTREHVATPAWEYADDRLQGWFTNFVYPLSTGEVVAVYRDITAEKRGAEALLEYKQFIENTDDMVAVVDRNFRYVMANRSYVDRYGQTRPVIGMTVAEIVGAEIFESTLRPRLERCFAGETVTFEIEHDFSGLGKRTLAVKYFPIAQVEGETISRVAAIIRDHTQAKEAEQKRDRLEAQLRHAQKMDALGTLAGGIAHDFNNILGAVLGYTELSIAEAAPDSDLRGNLEEVLRAARRAKDLVGQILAFSRKSAEVAAPIASQSVVSECLQLLRATVPTTIDIEYSISPETLMVFATQTQLHQIVMNLATNAYHSMGAAGGTLTLRLERSQVDNDQARQLDLAPGKYVTLQIADTGSGIAPEILENIFDPFFTTKPHGQGTGLGLSVVHGIVKDLHGAISVKTTVGQGSTFTVYFPLLKRPASPAPEASKPEVGPSGSKRVLLVDDESALVRLETKLLVSMGCQVTAFTDAAEALAAFEAAPDAFDLILTDQTMPKLTGSELVKRAKALRPDIQAIICTGHSELLDEAGARQIGASYLLRKPFFRSDLEQAIESL